MANQPPQAVALNPSPKLRFMQSPDNIKKHRDMIDSNEFQRACDFALLQYQSQLSMTTVDMAGAAANNFKMLGAQELLQTMRLLGESVPRVTKTDPDNLKPLE